MATISRGSERILIKLQSLLDNNEYYEAHQLYRTLYFRMINSKRYTEAAETLYKGALFLLEKNQINSGADLAALYVETIKKDPEIDSKMSNPSFKNEFATNVAKLFAQITPKTPERLNLIMNVIKLDDKVFPIAQIHHMIGLHLLKEQNYAEARYHFICSASYNQPDAAALLIEQHTKEGKPCEVEFFITQFVLQVLSRTRKASEPSLQGTHDNPSNIDLNQIKFRSDEHRYAVNIFNLYVTQHPMIRNSRPSFAYPLLNFIYLLFIAISRGKSQEFNTLRKSYQQLILVDEKYDQLLDSIGKVYFDINPSSNNSVGGILNNLLQQFMDFSDTDDDSSNTPPNAIRDASLQASSSRSNNFARTTSIRPSTSSNSQNKTQMNEQLDLD